MRITIRNINESIDIPNCICGSEPKLVIPDSNYTDCWIECSRCGLQTHNTGGYHYAMEIPIDEAKRNATIAWRQLIQKSKK